MPADVLEVLPGFLPFPKGNPTQPAPQSRDSDCAQYVSRSVSGK